jgi:hypothetical protein
MPWKPLLSVVIACAACAPVTAQQPNEDRPTRGQFDERGPTRSSPVGVQRSTATFTGVHDSTFVPHVSRPLSVTGVKLSNFNKSFPSGRLYMYRSPRWNTKKLYPNGFTRIMPLGLPKIPEEAVGRVKSSLAVLDNPRRFMVPDDSPSAEAPLAVIRMPRRFEPDVVRAMIVDQDRRQLERVGTAAAKTRKVDQARSDSVQKTEGRRSRYRKLANWNPFAPVRSRHTAIGHGAAYDPQLRPKAVEEEVPAFDTSLIGSNPTDAIAELRREVARTPGDYHLLRLLAIAHLTNRDMPTAASTIAKVYDADPLLVSNPLDLASLGLDMGRVTTLVTASQTYAANGGANAHLLTLVLQQAQGQSTKARATLDRARKAGLSPELADLFAAALK